MRFRFAKTALWGEARVNAALWKRRNIHCVFRRTLACVSALLALYSAVVTADNRSRSATYHLDIPEQSLDSTLRQLALASQHKLFYPSELVEGVNSCALKGEFTAEQAVQKLLSGTNLTYEITPSSVVLIRPKSSPHSATDNPSSLPQATEAGAHRADEGFFLAERSGQRENALRLAQAGSMERDASSNADQERSPEEVVVTGSRIARTGAAAPTPTTVLGEDQIEYSGSLNIQGVINELPAVAAGIQGNNSGNASFALAGLSMINLRDLDVRRSLVLVNGRRFTPTLTDADTNITAVDLSTVPTGMIERVEVITGGAGAVYGSDAVAGVVNLILKEDFEGLELTGQSGASGEGDGEAHMFSATGGANWSDGRGNTVIHYSYSENARVSLADRDFIVNRVDILPNPADTGAGDGIPSYLIGQGLNRVGIEARVVNFEAPRASTPDANGAFTTAGSMTRFAIDRTTGAVRLFDGEPTSSPARVFGGQDGSPVSETDLIVPVKRHLIAANTRYQVLPGAEAFFNLNYALTRTSNVIFRTFECQQCFRSRPDGVLTQTLPADHPFVLATPGLPELLEGDPSTDADDITEIAPDRRNFELGPLSVDIDRDLWQFVGGLRGEIANDWKWEVSAQVGESRVTTTTLNHPLEPNFYEAVVNVEADPDNPGQLRCVSALARAQGCIPFNILSNELQPAVADFLTVDHISRSRFLQTLYNGFITGPVFDLPAGPLRALAGVEYREEDVTVDQSEVWNSGNVFFGTTLPDLSGRLHVSELFVEARAPLLKDLPLVQELSLEGAARWADYSTAGNATSWNAGVDWTISDDVRLRGGVARAVRAPKVGELFTPTTRSSSVVNDPCSLPFIEDNPNRAANCAALGVPSGFIAPDATTGVILSGNRDLKPEEGDTYTFGVVLTPRWAPDLSLTADYWNIQIEQAITLFPFSDVLTNCVDAGTINNSFCALITREPTGVLDRVRSTFVNASVFETSGLDFEVDYIWDLGRLPGALRLSVLSTYLDERNFVLNPQVAGQASIADPKAGEHGTPRWRGSFGATYSNGPFDMNGQLRWIGSTVDDIRADRESPSALETGREYYLDLHARYQALDKVTIYGGVNNVFDNIPPRNPFVFAGTGRLDTPNQVGAALYDPTGRFFYAGVTVAWR